MKKVLKKLFEKVFIFKLLWVVCFLIKYKGQFEIYKDKNLFHKKDYIDIEDKRESFYIYTSLRQLIEDIYNY